MGPSLEFYSLVAAELQRRDLGLWLCDDQVPDDQAREVSTALSIPEGNIRKYSVWFSLLAYSFMIM